MKKTEIGRRVQEIDDRIASLYNEKKRFQERCKHTQAIKNKDSNWNTRDPLEVEVYWYDCYCPNCKKRWTEESFEKDKRLL